MIQGARGWRNAASQCDLQWQQRMTYLRLHLAVDSYPREVLCPGVAPLTLLCLIQGFCEQLLLCAVRQAETVARAKRQAALAWHPSAD